MKRKKFSIFFIACALSVFASCSQDNEIDKLSEGTSEEQYETLEMVLDLYTETGFMYHDERARHLSIISKVNQHVFESPLQEVQVQDKVKEIKSIILVADEFTDEKNISRYEKDPSGLPKKIKMFTGKQQGFNPRFASIEINLQTLIFLTIAFQLALATLNLKSKELEILLASGKSGKSGKSESLIYASTLYKEMVQRLMFAYIKYQDKTLHPVDARFPEDKKKYFLRKN